MLDRSLKALSLILSYPTEDLQQAMPEIAGVLIAEPGLTAAARRELSVLLEELELLDIYELQERYVMLFDRSRTLSLNLFEHIHGESRDRGGAPRPRWRSAPSSGRRPRTGPAASRCGPRAAPTRCE